ncbi:MAG TPA: hypothetical protein VGI39_17960 [Polyangiaceae bacterium]|jgi:hypothetical protein
MDLPSATRKLVDESGTLAELRAAIAVLRAKSDAAASLLDRREHVFLKLMDQAVDEFDRLVLEPRANGTRRPA